MAANDDYTQLARDYDWLVPSELRDGRSLRLQFAEPFEQLPPDAFLLDCACGTGWNVLALMAAGFRVVGSDASPAMIEVARANARAVGLDARFEVVEWVDLPVRMGQEFDGVLCVGNSIVHANASGEMAAALAAMRSVMRPGGWLMLDSRDWETNWTPGHSIDVPDRIEDRDGVRCLPIRCWDTPPIFSQSHNVEFVLIFEHPDGRLTTRRHRLSYRPFRLSELASALNHAGFDEMTSALDNGWLTVTARARSSPN